jgi:hypothetical protein
MGTHRNAKAKAQLLNRLRAAAFCFDDFWFEGFWFRKEKSPPSAIILQKTGYAVFPLVLKG